jgi:uncharacterized damage-inducible protein DinB
MSEASAPEVWLRGPVAGIPPLLQPVAHGLLQCREELRAIVPPLTPRDIWRRPAAAPSIGFHLQHAARSLDRLFTYARGDTLSEPQRRALAAEGRAASPPETALALLEEFDRSVDRALEQLRATDAARLLDHRGVGRQQLPSTVLGLLFHAAEHTQRHVGQITTTAKILKGLTGSADEP